MPCRKEAMPDKRERERRPAPIPYRPPKGRTEELRALVAASGLSTNAFITHCVFGRRRIALKLFARLLTETARIGDLLGDLAAAGADEHGAALDAAQQELAQIRAALLRGMGRLP